MTGMDKDYRWGHLDKQKVGRFGEYFAKMEFLRSGFDVYSPEVDDKAIDCLLRIDGPEPIYLEVQIKTVRLASPGFLANQLTSGKARSITDLANSTGTNAAEISRILPLAFLAPDMVRDILDGRQPIEMTAKRLSRLDHLPIKWKDQRSLLGF